MINLIQYHPVFAYMLILSHCFMQLKKKTKNYTKGHGDQFYHWMQTFHSNEYLYPFAQACGGSRQDISLEGCPAVSMKKCFLVLFFNDSLSISDDNILQKLLFITLQSVQFISLLKVLNIMHISFCLSTCWLRSNIDGLGDFDFQILDMELMVDKLESVLSNVSENGELMLNEYYIINNFSDL